MQNSIRMLKTLVPSGNRAKSALGKLRNAGDDAQRRRAWSESIPLYREYLALRGTDAAIWVQLGHALKESGDLAGAENAYRQALLVAPDGGDSRLHLVALLRRLGKVAEADTLERPYTESATSVPRFMGKGSNKTHGDAARDIKDWPRAVEFYADYLKSSSNDAAIWVQLGHALKEQSLLDEALYAYLTATHVDGGSLDAAEHLAILLGKMGRPSSNIPRWAALLNT